MIGWLIVAGYVACWLASSVYVTRWIADAKAVCNGRDRTGFKSICRQYHVADCWRPNGEIDMPRFAVATAVSGVWPLLIPLAVTWTLANKRPNVVDLQREIARLEGEVGIR